MSYTFGDMTTSGGYTLGQSSIGDYDFNYGGTPDYGFDLGMQDYSIDDFAYSPAPATPVSGWDKLTNTLSGIGDNIGDWADTYVNKWIDSELFGGTADQPAQNQGTVTPVSQAPAQAGFAVSNQTLMIGAGVVLALVLLARK